MPTSTRNRSCRQRSNRTAGNKLSTEKASAALTLLKVLGAEFVASATSDARFQRSAKAAASMDLALPRKRRAARSCTRRYRKMPKISTPAEWPNVLTSRDSFTLQSYTDRRVQRGQLRWLMRTDKPLYSRVVRGGNGSGYGP